MDIVSRSIVNAELNGVVRHSLNSTHIHFVIGNSSIICKDRKQLPQWNIRFKIKRNLLNGHKIARLLTFPFLRVSNFIFYRKGWCDSETKVLFVKQNQEMFKYLLTQVETFLPESCLLSQLSPHSSHSLTRYFSDN